MHGKKALRAQLESFTDIIKSGLIRTYAKGLLAFSGSKFEIVDGDDIDPNARSASITQLVYGSGDQTYTIRYQMGKRRDGTWRLRNLIVEDISQNWQIYQNQFASAAKAATAMLVKWWPSGMWRQTYQRTSMMNETMIINARGAFPGAKIDVQLDGRTVK